MMSTSRSARYCRIASTPFESSDTHSARIAVIIPCFRVKDQILDVIAQIPAYVTRIYVVDDACPQHTGQWVEAECRDQRVVVILNQRNLGVGGAVINGYSHAVIEGMEILVKLDGDGQMEPAAMLELISPVAEGEADYCKGNRFYDLTQIRQMPLIRIIGNALLSFMTKISTGYWDIFDPTNGYTAIHAKVLHRIPLEKLSTRFFFESDLLFRLSIIRAVVVDVPMDARYGSESSNLHIRKIALNFIFRHIVNAHKRIFYSYFLRDLSLASIQLLMGSAFIISSLFLGILFWVRSANTGLLASAGSVMLVALQVIVGLLLVQGFLAHDIASVPRRPLRRLLKPIYRCPLEADTDEL